MSEKTLVSVSTLAQFFFERSLSRNTQAVRKQDERAVQLSLLVVAKIPVERREKSQNDFEYAIGLIHELLALSISCTPEVLTKHIEITSGEIARLGK